MLIHFAKHRIDHVCQKENFLAVLVLSSLLLFSCSIQRDKVAIRRQNENFSSAWNRQDTASFASFYHQNFTVLFQNNKIERERYLFMLKAENAKIHQPVSLKVKPTDLVIKGDTASARMQETNSYQAKTKSGKLHAIRYEQYFESKWIKTGDGWQWIQLKFTQPTSEVWIDGVKSNRMALQELLSQ